jgi:hypothetical protein
MQPTHSQSERNSVSECLVAICRQAEFAATLVNGYLNALGYTASPSQPMALPRWFLLDLGSALQIAWWERSGVLGHIPESLPDSMNLLHQIFAVSENPRAFVEREPDQQLSVRVMTIHLRYFAFHSLPFKAAVILDQAKERDIVDALAIFLWKTRNQNDSNLGIGDGA